VLGIQDWLISTLNIPICAKSVQPFLFIIRVEKRVEQVQGEPNIQMGPQGQTDPAELARPLPVLVSLPVAQPSTGEIEAEVMTLFAQYRVPLLRYAVSFGVPVPDAEEIVQEVFLSLFRHLCLGRSRENLRGWIFRVAHNLTLKHRQRNRRSLEVVANDDGIAALRSDPSLNPEECCSQAERQERLLAVVRSLPDVEQRCLRLRAEGLRYREIAGILGVSLGSVAAYLSRSLSKLIRVDRG